jgi:hypothetical protein
MASPLPATVQRSPVRPWSRPLAVAFGFGRPRVGNRLIDGLLDLGVGEVLAGLGTLDDFGTGGIWGLKGARRRFKLANKIGALELLGKHHKLYIERHQHDVGAGLARDRAPDQQVLDINQLALHHGNFRPNFDPTA